MVEQKTQLKVEKKERSRSPSYPAFPLPEAIQRAKRLYEKEGLNWAYAHIAMKHWGYSPKSSSAMRTLAALIQYGLLEETGSGESRKVRLSERAKIVLLAPEERQQERQRALRESALSPNLYQKLWGRFGPNLPTSQNIEYELLRSGEYNTDSIRNLIRDFRATVEFAKLGDSDTLEDTQQGSSAMRDENTDSAPEYQGQGGQARTEQAGYSKVGMFEIPIPLPGNALAVLRMPRPMTEATFEFLRSLLTTSLDAMKPALVTKESE
jgi:hypothetical protein